MRALSGLNKAFGYALSMLLLAVASLVVIPAMIRASGDAAWGAIAVGQSVGAIAAVAVAYGWGLSGPVEVARGSAQQRRTEYLSSVKVRLVLLGPAVVVAAVVAWLLAAVRPDLAALGAISSSLVGLSANWFFVGLARPYVFLVVETIPRVAGTVVGILLMRGGADALVGLLCQAAGFVGAFIGSTLWICLFVRRAGATAEPTPPLPSMLRARGDGLVSALSSACYVSAPVIIVTALGIPGQPMYARVDKLQRQVSISLNPVVTVLQGWVPRGDPVRRAKQALLGCAVFSLAVGGGVWTFGPVLLDWLGAGGETPSRTIIALMTAFVMLNLMESAVSKAVLATLKRLRAVARATLVGAAVGLPLVAVGSLVKGAEGALIGVVTGLAVRLTWELVVAVRLLRDSDTA